MSDPSPRRVVTPVELPPILAALDEAVRGISNVLDIERVLQLIVDNVRDLVAARYAALGIVDDAGQITEFVTSGITAEQRNAIGDLPHGRGLLGLIIRENRSVRIDDIASHPDSSGFPPNHPPMRSFLGAPIISEGQPVGRLYLTDKQGADRFSAADQQLVEVFALHAGIAMRNAELHARVGRLAIVDERDRISRELHDSVIQAIYAVTLTLDDVPELMRDEPDEALERVDKSIDALHGVIRDIRNFIFGLRPLLLESGGLLDGLRSLADEIQRNTAIAIEVEGEEPEELPIHTVAEALAISREALANVARHSGASAASVSVERSDDVVLLQVADNGRGFVSDGDSVPGHHGLANMRSRTLALGGTLEVDSQPGTGTRIIATLPYETPAS
jgi:signal transduction histidine kinase